MIEFNQKTLLYLDNKFYVYALADPRTDEIFYIGKGINNRVFSHEIDAFKNENIENNKLKRIREIESEGFEVKKYILNTHLSEEEAFASESSLINLMKILGGLSNIVSGHGKMHEAMNVEEFNKIYGAYELKDEDIKNNLLCIKINRLYDKNDTSNSVYNKVRGYWKLNMKNLSEIEYVCAVYEGLIVGVYKPLEWHNAMDLVDNPRFKQDYRDCADYEEKEKNRKYFIGQDVSKTSEYYLKSVKENFIGPHDQNAIKYLWKR